MYCFAAYLRADLTADGVGKSFAIAPVLTSGAQAIKMPLLPQSEPSIDWAWNKTKESGAIFVSNLDKNERNDGSLEFHKNERMGRQTKTICRRNFFPRLIEIQEETLGPFNFPVWKSTFHLQEKHGV